MKRAKVLPTQARRPPPPVEGVAAEFEEMRVIERPDGFWVQSLSGGPERGPYADLIEAIDDQRDAEEEDSASGRELAEIEAELGVSDWIDPETSEPAEDSVPHLEEH